MSTPLLALTPPRAIFREYARDHTLTTKFMSFKERSALITTMMISWTGICTAKYPPQNRKQSIIEIPCERIIMLSKSSSPCATIARYARFDTETYCWLCIDCFKKKYPKPIHTTVGISKPSKPKISDAKLIYEKTGKRYNYDGKKPLGEIFDQSTANHNLNRTFKGAWIEYRCPHCDFYKNARLYQGWPEHTCKSSDSWK